MEAINFTEISSRDDATLQKTKIFIYVSVRISNLTLTFIIPNGVPSTGVNLLKPTGYVMHQQFDIQQLYALPTLYLCVLYLSENKQRLVPLTA